jgi:D-inositol-3-phosphate glycosyltransferase
MIAGDHKPRVAFLGYAHDARGGIAQFGRGLAQQVAERADVRMIGYRKLYPGFTRPGRQPPDPSLRELDLPAAKITVPWEPRTWKATADDVVAFGADLLVVQWWSPLFGPSIRSILRRVGKAGVRTLVMCHNDRPHEPFPLWRQITRASLSQADALVAFSEHVTNAVEAIVPGRKVQLSQFPYSLIQASGGAAEAWDDRLGSPNGPLILFFGNVRAYKGLEDLVAALPLVRRSVPASLVVAGTFMEPVERYAKQARELGVADHVRLLDGYVADDEVAGLFARSDVVALPYRSAMGSAVLGQAAVCGRPVVATTVGPLPAMIGDRGVLVPPQDPAALADGLVRALREPPPPPLAETGAWEQCRDIVLEHAQRRG